MKLDYNAHTQSFILYLGRPDFGRVAEIVNDHGWDVSKPASNADRRVLFTREPFAALAFFESGTEAARENLIPLWNEVERSRRKISNARFRTPYGKELWPFQRAGVEYALGRQNTLIGDQPGLGKTPTSIVLANELRAKRVLVVCPANIRLQWADMIYAWSTMEDRYIVYPILNSRRGVHPFAHWTIVSYDLARTGPIHAALSQGRYDLAILDEAHYLKTPDANRTKALFDEHTGLLAKAERVVALTGTPLPNRPRECYTLARSLAWDSIGYASEKDFRERYNPSRTVHKKDPWTGEILGLHKEEKVGRLPELQHRLRASFMVRREKREVLTQLPEIRHQIVHLEETGAIRKALEAESMLEIDPSNLKGANAKILGMISTVRLQMGVAMAEPAADYCDMLFDGGEDKLFIVAWHHAVMDILEKKLAKWGIVRVDGSSSPRWRQMAVEKFRTERGVRGFLGQMQAIGVGVDGLQGVCSHMVGVETSWTPGDNQQVVDRLHRIGQKEGVLADWLAVPNSFAERIIATATRKLRNIHSALDKDHG